MSLRAQGVTFAYAYGPPVRVRDIVRMGRSPHIGFLASERPRDRDVIEAAMLSSVFRTSVRVVGGPRPLVLPE